MTRSRALLAVLVGVFVVWGSQPFWPNNPPGQDVVPYHVQGRFVGVRDDLVFVQPGGGYGHMPPEVVEAQCVHLAEAVEDGPCSAYAVPPLGLPPALPVWVALAHLPLDAMRVVLRLAGALAFMGGTVVLWRRLDRHGDAGRLTVVLSALAMTPLVLRAGQLGQTSGILYLSAALAPTGGGRRARDLGASFVWAVAVVLKGFPLLLAGLQLFRRRIRSLAVLGAVVLAGTVGLVALVPPDVVGTYDDALGDLSSSSLGVPANRSLAAVLHAATDLDPAVLVVVCSVVVLSALLVGWWTVVRRAPAEVEWAWWSLGAVAASPILWGHYTAVAVAALGLALARLPVAVDEHADGAAPLLDRRLLALPIVAGALGLLATSGTTLTTSSPVQVVTYGVLVAVLVGIGVIVRTGGDARA